VTPARLRQAGAESQRLPAGVMATLAEALLDSSSVVRAAAGKAVLRAAGRGSAQGLEALAALLLASRASFTDEVPAVPPPPPAAAPTGSADARPSARGSEARARGSWCTRCTRSRARAGTRGWSRRCASQRTTRAPPRVSWRSRPSGASPARATTTPVPSCARPLRSLRPRPAARGAPAARPARATCVWTPPQRRARAQSGETIEVRARANKALAGLVAAGAGARAPAEGGSGRAAPRREDYTLLMMREDVAVRRRAVQLAARAPPGGAGLLRLQEALARRMKQDADLQVRRVAAASLAEVSPPPDAPVQQAMLEAALHEADRDTCAALLVLLAARAAPGDRLVTASLVHLLGAPAWQGAAGAPVRRRAAEGIARVVDPADAALGEALGLSALLLARARMPDEVVSVRRACHETHLRLRLHKPKTAQGEDSDDD
jgi:hypothetical protein